MIDKKKENNLNKIFEKDNIYITEKDIKNHVYEKGFNIWHTHKEYNLFVDDLSYSRIRISDNSGGCGIQQLYGWIGYEDKLYLDILLDTVLDDLHRGVGLLVCQVGEDFYNSELVKNLLLKNFTILNEYTNYQHNDEYTGRIYGLNIKK